jgi:hypothetical protein
MKVICIGEWMTDCDRDEHCKSCNHSGEHEYIPEDCDEVCNNGHGMRDDNKNRIDTKCCQPLDLRYYAKQANNK